MTIMALYMISIMGQSKKMTIITNMMIQVNMKRWKSSGSIYFVFAQYRYNSYL